MPVLLTNVEHWRDRAEEAHTLAAQARDPNVRRTLLDIAQGYEKLAAQAERWQEKERSKAKQVTEGRSAPGEAADMSDN